MKIITFVLILFSSILFLQSCDRNSLTTPQPVNNEYIIKAGGQKGFTVINIISAKSTGVPAVIQLEGAIYLQIHSYYPSFNKKVVAGVFVPDTNYHLNLRDTIFRITKHLRDTTSATVGN